MLSTWNTIEDDCLNNGRLSHSVSQASTQGMVPTCPLDLGMSEYMGA